MAHSVFTGNPSIPGDETRTAAEGVRPERATLSLFLPEMHPQRSMARARFFDGTSTTKLSARWAPGT